MGRESRRNPRFACSLELQIVGIDRRAVIRRGDISLSGLFVGLDRDVGKPGTVHVLRLRTRDKARRVEVQARLARVTSSDDLLCGVVVTGAGFEVLAYEAEAREAYADFVAHVAGSQLSTENPAEVIDAVSVRTDWPLRKGERLSIEVPSRNGGALRYAGYAVRSRKAKDGTYRTRVEWDAARAVEAEQEVGGIREALDQGPPHLAGELARFGLPSLLGLLALERASGRLRLDGPFGSATVFLRDGAVVDVSGDDDPIERLATLCRWDAGRFAMHLGRIRCADRVRTSTTALLLELARQEDELARVA